jgi:hypothetical protein
MTLPCGLTTWERFFPSDLRYEESVHHAARPLITRIAWTEDDRRSLVASQSVDVLLTCEDP